MNILNRPIATLFLAPESDKGGAAVLDAPEGNEPVNAPGQTSLSVAWLDAKNKLEAKNKAADVQEPDPSKIEKPEVKVDDTKKVEVDKEPAKKLSPLDAVLDPAKAKSEAAPIPDEIPANAPAKTLREAYERHKAEAVKWKAEAEKAAKGDPAINSKLETLQQEREKLAAENRELRDAVTALNVDYDPEVRRKYHDGKVALVESTVKYAEKFGADPKAFAEALALPEGKARTTALRDAMAEVDEMDRDRIYSKLTKISELEEEHSNLLKDSQKSYADISKKRQDQMTQRQQEADKSKLDVFEKATKALPSLHPTMNEVPDTVEDHATWNARLKADHAAGLHLISHDATFDEISAAAVKGARYDFVESLLMDERKETAALRERIAKYESAEPGFDGRQKVEKTSKLDKSPSEIYREKMEELRGKNI